MDARSSSSADTPPLPSSAHIEDLPSELIIHIMKACMIRKATKSPNRPRTKISPMPFDRRLSQVCRRWREIALTCSELWSVIPHRRRHPEWTKLCLSRCTSGPLHFVIPAQTDWVTTEESGVDETIRLVLPHLSRAQTLDLNLDLYSFELPVGDASNHPLIRLVIDALATQPAPLLKEMNINFRSPTSWRPVEEDFIDPRLPAILFDQQPLSQLRSAILGWCVIPRSLPFNAPSLRHLELYNVRGWRDIDGMIMCFQAIPLLESLVYSDDEHALMEDAPEFDTTRSETHPLRCVHLDKLAYIKLKRSFAYNTAIFSYLSIPTWAKISTYSPFDLGDTSLADYIAMLTEALASHYASAIAAGAHYDKVFVDDEKVHASVSSLNGCPSVLGQCTLGAPMYKLHGQFSERLKESPAFSPCLESYFSLPVFYQAKEIAFSANIRQHYPQTVERFTSQPFTPDTDLGIA